MQQLCMIMKINIYEQMQCRFGGRGRWFKSSHSDQIKSDKHLLIGFFCCSAAP